ncbi:MAG TPA: hypothetical protein VF734_12965 [Pseudonocardiaceae bacterium]
MGVVLLLLVLGLEYTADELITNVRRQAPVGVLDLLLRAGTTLVARGEFSIIIAGLVAASVTPAFAPTVTAYVLIMAVLGPLAPRLADPLVRHLARRDAKRRAADHQADERSAGP